MNEMFAKRELKRGEASLIIISLFPLIMGRGKRGMGSPNKKQVD